ncbi:MAG: dihydrodipicolinate synthase family protein, partial [Methanosarcinales archaeon]|nr:dihydrodipicolinate synthase family protein [Methanosarcinales archaeon]
MKIEGVLPALITPFTPERMIDETGFRENIEYVVEHGVSGIVPCGTTGESATLTSDEHEQLIDIAIDVSNVPVIAGTGSNNTEEAVRFTRHAADAGADAATPGRHPRPPDHHDLPVHASAPRNKTPLSSPPP